MNPQPNLKPVLTAVEHQPLAAHAERIRNALELVGAPLNNDQQKQLRAAMENKDASRRHQSHPSRPRSALPRRRQHQSRKPRESRRRAGRRELVQQGWRVFLVKVHNEAGVTAELRVTSPNAQLPYRRSTGSPEPNPAVKPDDVRDRWMDVDVFDKQPLAKRLSGLARSSTASSSSTAATPASARRSSPSTSARGRRTSASATRATSLFDCEPAVEVKLDVLDDDGKPTTGQFVIPRRAGPRLSRR